VVVGQPYPQPYPPPIFQPSCQQTAGQYGEGPTISCTRPDGSVSTTAAPPPPGPNPIPSPGSPPRAGADQGYANQPYPPPPQAGYTGGYDRGY
jgi:hypothetical protein